MRIRAFCSIAVAFAACLASSPQAFADKKPATSAATRPALPAPALGANFTDEWRIRRGLEIAPVELDFRGRSRAMVGLGSYLVNAVSGCNDCHTWPNYAPGGDPYRGEPKMVNAENYLAGGRPFGPFRSRNLTPDPAEELSEAELWEEFVSVMRTGVDPDNAHPAFGPLLQVMPWSVYQDMTDRDLHAIFEYLRAIPHAEPYCSGEHLSEPLCQP